MPPQSRFGASKYRNAVPHVSPREEWYRSFLPSSTSSSTGALSTFSNELKSNREYIITLTQSGELSFRGYEGSAGTARVGSGGGVGDWDLGRLEDGLLAVGRLDGAITIHSLPPISHDPASPVLVHTIPSSSSPITNLALHPTTPDLLLASTVTAPIRIYDLSSASTSPVLELNVSEPKGLWSTGWSGDGRLLATLSKSGALSTYDPRAGKEAVASRSLSFSLQALKPARLAWIGSDVFVTSFNKTRNRQYSLLSPAQGLSTVFSQSLDTSPNVLIPLVDEERRIVYTASKGDMTLRQIELSGPAGYQETLHPLPFPLASQGLALVHPSQLDVMKAEIAKILLPVVDKDGETVLPFGVRVPRRQLIDYHEDLYPDVTSTVPEQSATEWLKGQDKIPLPISLDPSRRGAWEGQLAKAAEQRQVSGSRLTQPQPHTAIASSPSASASEVTTLQPSSASSKTQQAVTASANTPSQATSTTISPPAVTAEAKSSPASNEPVHPSLPPLANGETYSSTSYKVRIIAGHISEQMQQHKTSGSKSPLFVGLQGPQGCGKTTLCTTLLERLKESNGITAAVLSLDDLYRTHDGLRKLAEDHPDNALLSGRGPPGTHDTDLAQKVLREVSGINESPDGSVDLPIFDKSLCGGEGDRSAETVKVKGPLDVFILEGWSMGFGPLTDSELEGAYQNCRQSSIKQYTSDHSFTSIKTLNEYLADFSSTIYPLFQALIQIEPVTYDYVFKWRLQQEHAMKVANGGKGMTDDQVHKFVERYMPGYELWSQEIWKSGTPWEGRGLKLRYGQDREVVEISKPKADVRSAGDTTRSGDESAQAAPEVATGSVQSSSAASKSTSQSNTASPRATAPTTKPVAPNPAPTDVQSISTNRQPYNPGWSRKFLAAKAPLIPTYDAVPPLSSLHQDSKVLKATPHLAFFPIQGTGGRLVVHPLKKKGRMPVGGEGYLAGGVEIVDFDVDLFDGRVAVAGEDGVIRVWRVSSEGMQGVGPEPDQVLKGKGVDKMTQIAFHPTAKDLLVGITNDHGKAHLRFWDLSSGEEARCIELSTSGAFNFSFSPDGRVAIAAKEGHIMVLDPRDPRPVVGKAHDSPRSYQIAWINQHHLVSLGFSRGSQRKINLYRLPSTPTESIETTFSLTIDVSPSVLFPVYDPDTAILYVWGKGERVIQSYEVHPDHEREPITKLPSYTAGTPQVAVAFLPKRVVDVKKVEIGKALRLTAKTLEEVTFSIPRNKPEFFQNDIYTPTLDVETPATTAAEWLSGSTAELRRLSLQPEGMTQLSQAPKTNAVKTKFVPATEVMSEEARKKKEMDELFARAKLDQSSDEDEPKRSGIDPPDDDW